LPLCQKGRTTKTKYGGLPPALFENMFVACVAIKVRQNRHKFMMEITDE